MCLRKLLFPYKKHIDNMGILYWGTCGASEASEIRILDITPSNNTERETKICALRQRESS